MSRGSGRDDGDLLAACRRGDEAAGERFVERHHRGLLRVAYLLTGDCERAEHLAASVLLATLSDPPDERVDARQDLLLDLARRYLERPARSTWLERNPESSFTVDDERSRVRAALDLLEPLDRALLVLSHYAGLSEQELQRSLMRGRSGSSRAVSNRDSRIERASGRVALAAGRPTGEPVADLLAYLLVDAPSRDLWPEITGPLKRAWAGRRRRQRLFTIAAAAMVLLILAGGVLWLADPRTEGGDERSAIETPATAGVTPTASDEPRAAFAAAAVPSPPPREIVSVPDLQLIRAVEQAGESRSGLYAYDPATNETRPLLDAGGAVSVSPDGRWIVSQRNLVGPPGGTLLAAAPLDGSGPGWDMRLPAVRAMAIGPGAVYGLNLPAPDAEHFQIQKIELATGAIVAAWDVDVEGVAPATATTQRLVASQDGERLYLLVERIDSSAQRSWSRSVLVYRPDDGALVDRFVHEPAPDGGRAARDFSISSARQLPGGRTLYSLAPDEHWQNLRLQFLDLDRGTTSSLRLPLVPRSTHSDFSHGDTEIHFVPSNTGAMLYVIQSRQRQVAVVDLLNRAVIGVFPLTPGEFELTEFELSLNRVSYLETQFSPDGTRLYLAVNWQKNQSIAGHPASSPIWVFDTASWQVISRWTVGGLPRSMTMSGDGTRLYIRSERADGSVQLTVLDTATGGDQGVRPGIATPEWPDVQALLSVTQLYHAQYGFRPAASDAIPDDNRIMAVLPGVRLEADGAMAGTEVTLTARVVHPLTGEPAANEGMLRFDPEATLAIELSSGDRRIILMPSNIEPGVYRGRARLDQPGAWDARITVINRDGSTWTVEQRAAIVVPAGLAASDGNAYTFAIRPANPITDRTITVRIWIVNAQTGRRLPEGVEIAGGLPRDARIILTHPDGERVEAPLQPLGHASFLVWPTFAVPGEWSAELVFKGDGGERISIDAGSLEIRNMLDAYQRVNPRPRQGGMVQ